MKVMLVDSAEDPVRLAFVFCFNKREGMTNQDGSKSPDKFEINPIFSPNGKNAEKVRDAIVAACKEKYGEEPVDVLDKDGVKTGEKKPAWKAIYDEFGDDQKGLRKGNLKRDKGEQVYAGFEDMVYVAARNTTRPGVYNRDGTPLVEEDGKPYAGCYGNVEIDVWALKKQGVKKRVCTDLLGVQFTRDGDAFGGGSAPSTAASFANLSAAEEPKRNPLD
jgi:hypothetical protein